MDFGKALAALKAGEKVSRHGWNGKGQYIELASQSDMLAEDWCIVEWSV